MVDKKDIEKFDEGAELWDSRKLGASEAHAKPVSDEQDKALDEAMGLHLLSFRIQKPIIEQLKQLAKLESIGYQPLMRQILTKYVRENEYKLEQLLTPQQASEKAEQLFTQAIKYKDIIPTLKEMSNERIGAECDYSNALSHANTFFCNAYEKCTDPILKNHLRLRLDQIRALLDGDLQEFHDKKYGKAV